jgi:DNA-binding winged helix-turn-helix (wHTH) protein
MMYRFGAFTLDEARQELTRAEQLVALEPQAWRVLCYLLHHRDRLVKKDELLEACWSGTFVSEAALMRCLSKLRQALGDRARQPEFIKTLHGQGFRFIAPVTLLDDASPPAAPSPAVPAQEAAETPVPPPASASPLVDVPPVSLLPVAAERRQVTVLWCALHEAVDLTERLDPEDLHDVLQAFYTICTERLAPYAGYVAQRRGEGALVYFGYPQA